MSILSEPLYYWSIWRAGNELRKNCLALLCLLVKIFFVGLQKLGRLLMMWSGKIQFTITYATSKLWLLITFFLLQFYMDLDPKYKRWFPRVLKKVLIAYYSSITELLHFYYLACVFSWCMWTMYRFMHNWQQSPSCSFFVSLSWERQKLWMPMNQMLI